MIRCLHTRRRGMTMVEILTAVAIIVVLAALVVGAGSAVFSNQRAKQTKGLLTSLDRVLEEFIVEQGRVPTYIAANYDQVPGSSNRLETFMGVDHSRYPDVSVFFAQVRGIGAADEIISGINARFLTLTPESTDDADNLLQQQPSVVDSWAIEDWRVQTSDWEVTLQQLVLYVHPDNRLAQALYGQCVNDRPYFVSSGPDTFYGLPEEEEQIVAFYDDLDASDDIQDILRRAREDNIYSYTVDTGFLVPSVLLP